MIRLRKTMLDELQRLNYSAATIRCFDLAESHVYNHESAGVRSVEYRLLRLNASKASFPAAFVLTVKSDR